MSNLTETPSVIKIIYWKPNTGDELLQVIADILFADDSQKKYERMKNYLLNVWSEAVDDKTFFKKVGSSGPLQGYSAIRYIDVIPPHQLSNRMVEFKKHGWERIIAHNFSPIYQLL